MPYEVEVPADIGHILDYKIAYRRIFFKITKSMPAAMMLSQAYYWTPRSKHAGWFYKSRKQWEHETGLKRNEQETARKLLKELGFLNEHVEMRGRQLWFKADIAAIFQAIRKYAEIHPVEMLAEFPAPEREEPANLIEFKTA